MTKTTSVVLMCVITVIALFFGIFAFILDGQALGINDYNNAYGLIQKGGMFGDTVEATYQVKLDEGADSKQVIKTIKNRLQGIYGYYSVDVTEKDSVITINLPKATNAKTSGGESTATVDSRILSTVTQNGKLEILSTEYNQSSSQPTYSEDLVVISQEHLRSANTRTYVNGEYTYYICQARLTKEGTELVKKAKLSDNSMYYYAIDGEVTYVVNYTNGQFQIYGTDQNHSKLLSSIVNSGNLNATLTQLETIDRDNTLSWLLPAILGVLMLGTFVFFAARYKLLGLAPILSQLIVSVALIYALALIYMSTLNLFAAIALVLVYAFMSFFSILVFERILAKSSEKTVSASAYYGFHSVNIISLIAHGALFVLGIILWVIPTAVTAPMGPVFVYGAILSFAATFGLNRLFVKFVEPFYETSGKSVANK